MWPCVLAQSVLRRSRIGGDATPPVPEAQSIDTATLRRKLATISGVTMAVRTTANVRVRTRKPLDTPS
jgi:hypothetical protein